MEMEEGSMSGRCMYWGKQRGVVRENERKRVSESQCQRDSGTGQVSKENRESGRGQRCILLLLVLKETVC